jgi:phosphatidylglycerophosphate synthase
MLTAFRKIPRVLLAITLGRLALVPVMIVSFDVTPAITISALAVFIAIDLYDGVLARRLDADDTARRTLDTVVDRLSIWPGYLVVTIEGYLSFALLALFAVREIYTGYWCRRLLVERDVVIRADWMCRGLNLMLAGWVIAAPFASATARDSLFVAVLVVAVVVAVDVAGSLRSVLCMPEQVRSRVIPAAELRAGRGELFGRGRWSVSALFVNVGSKPKRHDDGHDAGAQAPTPAQPLRSLNIARP